MRRSRLAWAGLISVLLHAAILALIWEQEPVRPVSAPEAEPLIVEVLSSPPEPPAPPPAPQQPPPARAEPPRPVPRPPVPAERPAPRPEASPPKPPPSRPAAQEAAPAPSPASGRPEDAPLVEEPKRPSLLPPTPSGGWSVPETAEAPRGRTLHPDDPSLSPEVLKAEEQARVSERVQTFAEDDLATLRVENGLVHPYFSQIRTSLAKQMENAPLFDLEGTGKRLARGYLKRAQSYGATGSTGARSVARRPIDRAPPSASERLESLSKGNPTHDSMRAFLQAGESLQQLAQPSADLVIILELKQGPDGQLRSVQVVERSGNKAFDQYVLDAVPPALAKLTPPPTEALGRHPDGIRTLWAVEGRVIYLRKLSELKGQDAWYVASAAGLGVLAGTFEETTGDIYVIDLRNPKFECRPRLLRVW